MSSPKDESSQRTLVHAACWEQFVDVVELPSQIVLDVRAPDFDNLLAAELCDQRHAFCAMTAIDEQNRAGARVSMARVDSRWWTFTQHGAHLELYGVSAAVDLSTPVYEFLEPLWYSAILLPWNAAIDEAEAIAAARLVLVGNEVRSATFPQLAEELGMGRLEHHFKTPLHPQDFDLASTEFSARNPVD